jgi:hypothetical protein
MPIEPVMVDFLHCCGYREVENIDRILHGKIRKSEAGNIVDSQSGGKIVAFVDRILFENGVLNGKSVEESFLDEGWEIVLKTKNLVQVERTSRIPEKGKKTNV